MIKQSFFFYLKDHIFINNYIQKYIDMLLLKSSKEQKVSSLSKGLSHIWTRKMRNEKKEKKMKILTYYTIQMLEENHFSHTIHFEFMEKEFIAYVIENPETTYIDRCYNLKDEDIDIPTYFGTGFSSEIYSLIYNQVDKKSL